MKTALRSVGVQHVRGSEALGTGAGCVSSWKPLNQAYSMTMHAGWRSVIASRSPPVGGCKPTDLAPQSIAWLMLGVALSAYEYWLADETVGLPQALGEAFDAVAGGLG